MASGLKLGWQEVQEQSAKAFEEDVIKFLVQSSREVFSIVRIQLS